MIVISSIEPPRWMYVITDKRLDRATCCLHAPKFEARLFGRRHLGETTLCATALVLRSEDYESKTYKLVVQNPCYFPTHHCFIVTFTNWSPTANWSYQDGCLKFLGIKNEIIEARASLFLRSVEVEVEVHILDVKTEVSPRFSNWSSLPVKISLPVKRHLPTYLTTPHWGFSGPMKPTTEINWTG